MIIRSTLSSLIPVCLRWASRSCQMVGTPAARVTSSETMSPTSFALSRPGPGNTSLAPHINAAYGIPQALT